ncbi:endonuclease MutS2 [Treponema sp.]|uniref:endonuclease MutS2 n=1 Tax=Treponema sp. TaxID=166 RepID=UPI003F0F7842
MSGCENIFLKGQVASDFDFYKIRETVASYASTEEGKKLLLSRESSADPEEILKLKQLGREWSLYLNSRFPSALKPWPPVREIFSALKVEGSSLLHEQIFALGLFCLYADETSSLIKTAALELEIPSLLNIAKSSPSMENAAKLIFSVIDVSTGEVKDLPGLREIRKRIASLHREIDSVLKRYTSDSTLNSVLQSNVPVLKADRELLAVRADHSGAVKGIVHEVSPSRQTVYIEPEEIVRANNQLVQEEFNLQAELKKIFTEISERLREYCSDFTVCHDLMLLLDSTCAAARYQAAVGGVFAAECSCENEPPLILNARHPLLGSAAVPVTIRFMPEKSVMIITGPNTGGKTVTLKTVALFALMNQAGFPVPADEGTRLPFFSSVFADIGDEQSIEESLSTFSSRMKKIAVAIQHADSRSLVLLDELGTGTDPLEGGAIAMAILDSLLEKKAFVLVTTHHGVLKNYGYTNPRCVNASVEFSAQSLRPTYKLLVGVSGESHAIDIALNSGLPQEVVVQAKKYISNQQADVSSLIKGLTEKHAELEELVEKQKQKEAELSQKEFKIHSREARILQKEVELAQDEHLHSSAFLRETRSKLENLVRVLREGEITREKTLGVKKFLSELTEKVGAQEEAIEAKKENLKNELAALEQEEQKILQNGIRISKLKDKKNISSKKSRSRISNSEALKNAEALRFENSLKKKNRNVDSLKEGDEVFAGPEKRSGVLLRKEKNGLWQVQFGSMKMNFPENQLIPAKKDNAPATGSVSFVIERDFDSEKNTEAPKYELRLLGMRCESAIKELEHQIDLCVTSNFKKFSVIHGKGNGILQQAVTDYLKQCQCVKNFYFARPEEGGSGKTYVELI